MDEEEAVSVQYQIAGEIRENHVARMWRDVLDLNITGQTLDCNDNEVFC